ncbi:branched-chain amino acid ABC transporter permease [Polynucleobacter wuianus]|uniref:branched-chain amino acid ABC transporter permease n=1 Tax=Polynucleobacter wuianus TaxID=1743168 RepID=UPI001C0BBB62|nr:branched-chain amino acid ABC transporter permease [Polynucleobacter wuianus]MBU3611038.1 branched-chain amino acid ABC transporter permease [Polynucleobacter wuianus]
MKNKASFFFIPFFVLLLLMPLVGNEYSNDWVVKTVIFSIFALSLELLVGTTGLICFGQAAFFGVGAYATVLLTSQFPDPSLWFLVITSVLFAAVLALFVGALSLRTKGVYFIMVTLAFAQMVYYVIHDTPLGGGTDGIYLSSKPMLFSNYGLGNATVFYFFTVACLLAVLLLLGVLLRSRFGHALVGIRINENRMNAAGYETYFYKLAVFVISGGIAGLAGFLYAIKDGFVNPELLSWHQSGAVLIMIILGGLGHLRGAVIGAFAFALLEEIFRSEALFGAFSKHWHLGLGLAIILCVALLPKGLISLPSQWRVRLMGNDGSTVANETANGDKS